MSPVSKGLLSIRSEESSVFILNQSSYNNIDSLMSNKSKNYKIQCYSTPFFGHNIPLAKVAQVLTNNMPNVDVKVVTFELLRDRISKQFKSVSFEYLYPEITPEIQEKISCGDQMQMFALTFSQFGDYLESKKEYPDLIIADMFAVAPMKYAKKHGIPLIINFPNSYTSIQKIMNFFSLGRCMNIEGFLINSPLPKHPFLDVFDNILNAARSHGRFIFHSFIGLDEPNLMPANISLVGLMHNRSQSQLTPELTQWIEGWKSQGKKKFLYVSFGSMLRLSDKFAKKLADSFIKLGYPTIWSLRAPNAEEIKNPLIFHRPWLPQEAILRLPQVRCYMTHCGWGSITQSITSKTPLVGVPAFGDQPQNGQLICRKKIGVVLYQTFNFEIAAEHQVDVSEEQIIKGVSEVIEDQSYYQAIERLSRMSALHNSTQNICRVVTESLEFGNGHLIHPLAEEATLKTENTLSKIIKEDYIPKANQ